MLYAIPGALLSGCCAIASSFAGFAAGLLTETCTKTKLNEKELSLLSSTAMLLANEAVYQTIDYAIDDPMINTASKCSFLALSGFFIGISSLIPSKTHGLYFFHPVGASVVTGSVLSGYLVSVVELLLESRFAHLSGAITTITLAHFFSLERLKKDL